MSDDHLRDTMVPPRDFAEAGATLWREVTDYLTAEGATLDVIERQHLANACRLADRAALIEAELEENPDQVVPGSRNQPIAAPLVTEYRMYLGQLDTALARIKLPTDAAEQTPRSVHGRAAAFKRWGTA